MLDNRELAELKKALEERERQLVSEIQAGRTQAAREPFERLAGEAPDAGDASVADVAIDLATAERTRDSQELREVRGALARMDAGNLRLVPRVRGADSDRTPAGVAGCAV